MSRIGKYLIVLSLVAILLAGIAFAETRQATSTTTGALPQLEIDYLDVGQGDSIYIRTPDNIDMLIDGGPDKRVLAELGQVMPFWDHEIDVLVLTHPHSDHVAGLVEVMRRYKVKRVYYTGVIHTTADYLAWLDEIRKQHIPLYIVAGAQAIELGENAKVDFVYPMQDLSNKKVEELNDSSIVMKLTYGATKFLFMGDAEIPVERELIDEGVDLSADVLKVGHHGSRSSTDEEFLRLVNPKIAVIQVGLDNDFGHPHLITLERFRRSNIEILRNDEMGLIQLFSDGTKVLRK